MNILTIYILNFILLLLFFLFSLMPFSGFGISFLEVNEKFSAASLPPYLKIQPLVGTNTFKFC